MESSWLARLGEKYPEHESNYEMEDLCVLRAEKEIGIDVSQDDGMEENLLRGWQTTVTSPHKLRKSVETFEPLRLSK